MGQVSPWSLGFFDYTVKVTPKYKCSVLHLTLRQMCDSQPVLGVVRAVLSSKGD